MQIVGRNGIEYHIPEVYTGPKYKNSRSLAIKTHLNVAYTTSPVTAN